MATCKRSEQIMRKHHFNTSAAWLFRQAWCTDYANDRHKVGSGEAWRRNKDKLHQAWEAYMHSVLSPTWLSLLLLLERYRDRQRAWLEPGGYFFTKARNRRKKIRESLRPKKRAVNVEDQLTHAEHIYREALQQEGERFENTLVIVTLFLAGSITPGGTQPAHVPSIARHPYKRRRKRWRLWNHSITDSLRYLHRIGFLQQPREDGPRL